MVSLLNQYSDVAAVSRMGRDGDESLCRDWNEWMRVRCDFSGQWAPAGYIAPDAYSRGEADWDMLFHCFYFDTFSRGGVGWLGVCCLVV